jgi:hypothetical protein
MTAKPPPSIAVMKLTKPELIAACDQFRDKALADHEEARRWMTRAQIAESRLAVLRAAYEPQGIDS